MSLCRSGWDHLREKKIYSLENFYTTKKKKKKKSHLRAGVELYGHFSSQNSKHRWLESCACDNSRLLSINNTCHFCFTEAVTYCSKWLSMQGPACCPRVHISSIQNLKGPSSIQPATIATRPWLWVRQPRRSSPPAALRPEVRARVSARYVLGMGCPAALILGLQGVKREAGLSDGYLPFLRVPCNFGEMLLVLWVKEMNNTIQL